MSNDLERIYNDANTALAKKDYDSAADLFRQILLVDYNYKDASQLLARAIRLKLRRWYNDPRVWGGVGILVIVVILVWLVPRIQLSVAATTDLTSSPTLTLELSSTLIPTPTLTPTPIPVPLAWKRLSIGEFLPRDTVNSIVVDPKDTDVVYAGMNNSGIYKTINGGISWQPYHVGLGRADVTDIFIDENTGNLLVIAFPDKISHSINGGQTWETTIQDYQYYLPMFISQKNNQY